MEIKNIINFEEFEKIDLRIGRIIEAERVEGSDKIIKTVVDVGGERRQILAGIGKHYSPESLINKDIVIVINLSPRKIMNFESEGMILAVKDEENLSILTTDKIIKNGSIIS
jgi:methionine--tRNA ligase beta chain